MDAWHTKLESVSIISVDLAILLFPKWKWYKEETTTTTTKSKNESVPCREGIQLLHTIVIMQSRNPLWFLQWPSFEFV